MPSYKFTYFGVRGRGEIARYVFHAAGRDFEDNKITGEEWKDLKSKVQFGQVPILEIDGKQLAQSNAIARYLAREFGLAGKDSFEQAQVDELLELGSDMFQEVVKMFFEKDEDKKKELEKNLGEVVFPKFLGLFEKSLEANGGKYFVGNALTLGDLGVYNAFDTSIMKTPNLMDKFPKLKAHRAMVEAVPKLGDYIKTRPKTDI